MIGLYHYAPGKHFTFLVKTNPTKLFSLNLVTNNHFSFWGSMKSLYQLSSLSDSPINQAVISSIVSSSIVKDVRNMISFGYFSRAICSFSFVWRKVSYKSSAPNK